MGVKISALSAGSTPAGTETLPAVQSGATVKLTCAQIAGALAIAALSLVGNATGSAANAANISLGATLAFSGSALQTGAGTGDVTWSANSFVTTLATAQPAVHTWALAQTFTVAPVFTDASGSRTALGLGTAATATTGTSGATLPFLNGNNSWSGTNATTTNGAVSAPARTFTGTWFSGGDATTTKPLILIEPSGATSTGWSTSGTGLGINAASGFAGNVIAAGRNGTMSFTVRQDGAITGASLALSAAGINMPGGTGTSGIYTNGYGTQIGINNLLNVQSAASGNVDIASDSASLRLGASSDAILKRAGANMFGFGGSTSSFPALKRSTTSLLVKLADDSAFAVLQAKLTTDTAATTGLMAGVLSALTNASIVLYDSTGQAYRVPCTI